MSASIPVVTVATWEVNAGSMTAVLDILDALRERSLAEDGCLGYEVYRHIHNADTLLLVEQYRDDAALAAHRASAHFRELVVEGVIPLLKKRQVDILQPRG